MGDLGGEPDRLRRYLEEIAPQPIVNQCLFSFPMRWRFIPPIEASGTTQMAIDAWLLEQHRSFDHPPTLRFYTWQPIAISLGYHQRRYPEHWNGLTWKGDPIELVKRPSGGRAVLHQGDLTYAVITSGFAGNRIDAYQAICEFLIEGLRSLGVELHYGQAGRGYIHNPNCFGTATGADLVTADGAKLIGSAQLRKDQAILQHGSIRLAPDVELFEKVFDETHVPINLGINRDRLMSALVDAAKKTFQMDDWMEQPLSETEWAQVDRLNPNFSLRNSNETPHAH